MCTSKRDTEYRIYTCSSPIELGGVSKVNTKHIQSEYLAPELTSESAQTSQKHACTCVCLCVGVVSLYFMVNETYLTHYVHTYFPLRNNPLIEGVNTEAARVEMYNYSKR